MNNNNQKRVLYVASTYLHIKSFHIPYINWLQQNNCVVDCAFYGNDKIENSNKTWNIHFHRSPFSPKNIRAYKSLKRIIDSEKYDLIHCHTPMASVLTRLAARKSRKQGTKVLYTSHGFHFFKGSPATAWLFYYPVEKILSLFTDGIITINKEDYKILIERKFYSEKKFYIPGIGIDPDRMASKSSLDENLRRKLGVDKETIVLLYIAEFIPRKNHDFIIKSLPDLLKYSKNIKILFAGGGILKEKMQKQVHEMNLDSYFIFLGFTKEIGKYIRITDIGISSSRQEGLGLGVAEILYHGKPVVISQDRGHRELVKPGYNGFLFEQNNSDQFIQYIRQLIDDKKLRTDMGNQGRVMMNNFLIDNSLKEMSIIYKTLI